MLTLNFSTVKLIFFVIFDPKYSAGNHLHPIYQISRNLYNICFQADRATPRQTLTPFMCMAVPTAMIPHRVVIIPPLIRLQLTSSGRLEKDSISRIGRARDE